MNPRLSNRLLLVSLLLSLGLACRDPAPAPAARAAPPRVSPDATGMPFDVGAVIRRVHFAYRPAGDGWTAGHSTWSARVTSQGLTFTPRHALAPASESHKDPRLARNEPTRRILEGTPVTLGTAVLSRGGRLLDGTAPRGTVQEDGSLALSRGEVEEQLENSEAGITQHLRFTREPGGEGELRIRVPVSGLPFAGETPRGAHFADATGLGIRYGEATWTDASGKKTELRAQAVEGAVEFLVPAALLAGSSFPSTMAFSVSPEFGLDLPVSDPGAGTQREPAVASNGTDFLVVWTDTRNGAGTTDLYGTRVSESGAILDPLGIDISGDVNGQSYAALIFDGTNYFVVWEDSRRGSGTDIYGARISPSGAVLDPNGVAIATSGTLGNFKNQPKLAFDGTNFLVVWQEQYGYTTPFDLYGQRVSRTGALVGPSITVCNATSTQINAALAFDGTNYLVVWQDNRPGSHYDLYGARISTTGTVLDPSGRALITTSASQANPTVAFNGTSYFIAWTEFATQGDIYGARIRTDGSVLDPSGLPLIQATGNQDRPKLLRRGNEYLLAWQDFRAGQWDIYAARVNFTGASIDGQGFPISTASGSQTGPVTAASATRALIVWTDSQAYDIRGARLDTARTVLDPAGFTISTAPNSQLSPALAFDGTNYLVAWHDNRDGEFNIYGVRVSSSGTVLDPAGFAISTAIGQQRYPALSFDGTNYLVVWEDARVSFTDIYGARVSPAGTVLDPSGFLIFDRVDWQEHPAVAFDGTNHLVVWESLSGSIVIIRGARISPAGTVLDPSAITLGSSPQSRYDPQLAFDGTNYLVIWSDYRDAPYFDIYGTRVSPAGTVLDPNGILLAGGTDSQRNPALAFDGNHYLVVWGDHRGWDLFARRFTPGGTSPDTAPIPVSQAAQTQYYPSVTYDGAEFVVAWQDNRSGAGYDIYGGRITRAGVPRDGDGFIISASSTAEVSPVLASSGGGNSLVVYQSRDVSLGSNVQRLRARRLNQTNNPPTANPGSVTTAEDVPASVVLSGNDPDGDALTYTIVTAPEHGTLTGTAPNLTYTPVPDFHGADSFTFTISDGQVSSAPATVSLTVLTRNDAPVAQSLSLRTDEDTPVLVPLSGTDADGDTLSFTVVLGPSHGTLTGTAPHLTYTPAPGYYGPDSFTFTVSDGQTTSAPATVSLTVTSVDDLPIANDQDLTTSEDTAVTLMLTGTDGDGTSLAFSLASMPAHGRLTGVAPSLTYTPAANYHGPDSFTFTVTDGRVTSAPATVSITVEARNDTPVAVARSLTLDEDTATELTLTGSDVDGDNLSFTVASQPAHGALTGTAPDFTYTPEPGYHGPDSFTFTVSDGQATSAAATVSLSIVSRNDAPVSEPQALTVAAGHPTPIYLSGTDEDGDPLTFTIVAAPEVGKLTGAPPDLVYTAPPSFRGSTHFTFSVSDGAASSRSEVQLTVEKRALTVSAAVDSRRPAEGQQVRFYANAVDEASAPITLEWNFGDGQSSQEELPVHAFAAAGTYDVQLKATTTTEEATTTLRIRVRPAAAIPIAASTTVSAPLTGEEGSALTFRADDPLPALTYTWDFGDGTSAATGATATHAWADDGRFTLKLTASDSSGARWIATRVITIHNAPPVPLPQARVTARVGEPLSLQLAGADAAGAKDPLHWELLSGEGMLSAGGAFHWTPSEPGLATIVTTVSDDDGGEARLAFQVSTDGSTEPEPGPTEPSEGCGCGTTTGTTSGALWLGLLLALLTFSRRPLG